MNKVHETTHPPHSNHFQIKEEKDEPNAAISGNSVRSISPSNHNAPPRQNQQYSSAPTSNPCVSFQSPPPVPVSQLHQLPHFTLNQHGYPPANQPQSLWMPHQHPGVNGLPFFHSFAPHQYPGVHANWQPNDHTHVPNLRNQVGYAYPPCPGPWDPSSWWGQPPLAYAFPGSYSQVSQRHPMMPPSSTPSEQSSERGIIKLSAKLSQKHQQLWEAQSAENVKLWTVIDQLQSELADFKSLVVKLEAEISSLKQATGEPITRVTSTGGQQPAKRGRPMRSAFLVDALPSLDESRPCTQGRKIREPIFEKVILSKAENNVKPVHMAALAQHGKGKVSNLMTGEGKGLNCSVMNGSNATMPSFHNQAHKENAIMQNGGVNNNGKVTDANDAFTILKGMDHKTALASCHAGTGRDNGSLGWSYAILPQVNRNIFTNMNPQSFCNNSSVIKEGEKVNGGRGVGNEEDASDELDDAITAKAEDDNDEEMEEDESSSGEEIGC